jgi:ectoine hydroxylase-related dioxygenase (phytanoyl-CoA dioxygenase family)
MISDQDIRFYREQGYLVVENALSEDQVLTLRGVVDDWVERSRYVSANDDFHDLEDSHTAAAPRVRRFKDPDLHHVAFRALINNPKAVQVLEALWDGVGVRFDKSKLNTKLEGGGAAVEWHQDWAFYPHTNDNLAAVGFMIDDMTVENGPMMVIPGSHRGPVYSHHAKGVFCGAIDVERESIDTGQAVMLTGKAGSITIHHVRMLHASAPNLSDSPRRFLLHQYTAADAWPLLGVEDYDAFRSNLVSGEEVASPRMESLPLTMPYPEALHQGSIYENQRMLSKRFFPNKPNPEQ